MRTRIPCLLLAVPWLCLSAAAEPPSDAARIAALIEQLGSPQFAEREAATQLLDQIGLPALAALRRATHDKDGEIVRRAKELVERLERRQETAQALEAPRLRLVYKDAPLSEVVADFARKTGLPVQLDPKEQARLSQRRLTLDTGEVTPWEAYEQLCDRAGLTETQPSAPPTAPPNPYGVYSGRLPVAANPYAAPETAAKLTLTEGKRPAVPTYLAGRLRLQALAGRGPVAGVSAREGEVLFPLEIAPAPGLDVQEFISLRVNRAVDDKGQMLQQPGAYLAAEGVFAANPRDMVVLVDGAYNLPASAGPQRHQLPLVLKRGSQPSRTLRELHGTLAATVLTPPRPLMTVDNVLKAAGRTVKGEDGGSLRVLEVKNDHGRLTLKVELQTPPEENVGLWTPAGQVIALQRAVVLRQLAVANANGSIVTAPRDLTLVDGRGQTILPQQARQLAGNGEAVQYELTYLLAKEQGADKLIYTGRRRVLIEVPFTLKDVPLP